MWLIPEYFWIWIWYDASELHKVPQIPRYDIGLYHSWSSEITILEYIDEILDASDKAYPKGGGTKSSSASYIIFKLNKSQVQWPYHLYWVPK